MYKAVPLILILSACTRIVPDTVSQLNALSPLEADPAGFAVALTLPDGLDVTPHSTRLMFAVSRADTGETRDGAFVLERASADQAIYQIAPRDLNALRALQDVARQWKSENDDATSGSLNVTMSPCRVGAGPADDARASVDIRIDADGPFLPLIRKGPISALAEPEHIRNMGACSIHR